MALYRSPDYQTGFESIGFSVQQKKLKYFKMDAKVAILDFQSMMLTIFFYLLVTSIFPKLPVKWPFGFRKKSK